MVFRTRITVRLTPRASREEIAGIRENVWHVRVTAPPVDGAANAALVRLLVKRLGVGRSALSIVSGETARTKIIEITGLAEAEVRSRLAVG